MLVYVIAKSGKRYQAYVPEVDRIDRDTALVACWQVFGTYVPGTRVSNFWSHHTL